MSPEVSGLSPGKRRLLIGVVVALGAALGVALLVIAVLLGRLSVTAEGAARRAGETPAPISASPAREAPATPPVPAVADVAQLPPDLGPGNVPREASATGTAVTLPTIAVGPGGESSDRSRIAAYLQEVDRLEDMGAGDPQAFARSLMESVSSGDFSGFDALLAKARAQQDRLRSITPPPACVEHHRLASALARDSTFLMERLKAALMKGDAAGLMAMSTEGQTLEARVGELRTLAAAIRRQAGL